MTDKPTLASTLTDALAERGRAAVFAETSLFILPSLSDNFGIVVAESLAHVVPVLAIVGTSWQDLLMRGRGWHVVPDVPTLRVRLDGAMMLPATERRVMGDRGHAFVLEGPGWDIIADRMLESYQGTLATDNQPDFTYAR